MRNEQSWWLYLSMNSQRLGLLMLPTNHRLPLTATARCLPSSPSTVHHHRRRCLSCHSHCRRSPPLPAAATVSLRGDAVYGPALTPVLRRGLVQRCSEYISGGDLGMVIGGREFGRDRGAWAGPCVAATEETKREMNYIPIDVKLTVYLCIQARR